MHYCNDSYPREILSTKWNLSHEEITRITSPSQEWEKQQQCHVINLDWRNLTAQDVQDLLSRSNSNGSALLEAQYGVLPCTNHVHNDTQYGLTLVEQVCFKSQNLFLDFIERLWLEIQLVNKHSSTCLKISAVMDIFLCKMVESHIFMIMCITECICRDLKYNFTQWLYSMNFDWKGCAVHES